MYLGEAYTPYRMAGRLTVSGKLHPLGQVPVVETKNERTFLDQIAGMIPFALVMFGVSVASSLAVYGLTSAMRNRG